MMISVVIPLYNKVQHITRAINSVLAQTYQNFELIVVDDGSTDGSGEVVRRISDLRIRLITEKNAGVSAARNRGISEALGELVAFLDADDEWLPGFLDTVLDLRARYPEAGMYATSYRFCKDAIVWRPAFVDCPEELQGGLIQDYFQAGLGPPPVCSSAVMIPRRILQEAGGFPVGLQRGEDIQVWTRIALLYRVAWSPVDSAKYNLFAQKSACNDAPLGPDVGAAVAIEEFLQADREALSPRHHIEEYLAAMRLTHAMACHLRGNRTWALDLLEKTRNTAMFRKRRRRLKFIVLFPPGVARVVLWVRALISTMTQEFMRGR